MKSTLFKRQLLFTVLLTLGFVVIALIAAFLASEFDHEKFGPRPAVFYANMLDEIVTSQKITPQQALAVLQKANSNSLPFNLSLSDRAHLPKELDFFPLPPPPNDVAGEHPEGGPRGEAGETPPASPGAAPGGPVGPKGMRMGVPPIGAALLGIHGRGRRIGGRELHSFAVPLRSDPDTYLVLDFSAHKGLFSPRERILVYNFVALGIAVLFASAISLFGLFYSMRSKARLAAKIINEIKSGNMKARFPIGKADEVGQLMIEFNKMAEDIEDLIQQLKAKEQGRMSLLQELAHDLRTPVASLKNLLETMHNRRENLKAEVRDELMGLSLKEVDYFGRLIEDLLTWAQVTEPTYFVAQHEIDLTTTIEEEIESAKVSLSAANKSLRIIRDFDNEPIHLKADPHLMRRMLRNALGNAFSFAKQSVTISAHSVDNEILISVRDDGPGLSDEALKNFGEKRITRSFGGQVQDGRLSLGLGSLIMKSIAQLHRGQIEISNASQSGSSTGAVLVIRLPKA